MIVAFIVGTLIGFGGCFYLVRKGYIKVYSN